MYEEFFGLKEKPFSIQPDPSFLYWGRAHRLAYAMLEYGVVNQAGISVITGEVGCGKTTLIHWLLNQLSDTHTIALLSNIQSGRGDLLSWVLMGFGEPFAGQSHVEMFAQLQQFFIREYSKGKRVVLIIDEAQNLSIDMLEEIRMLSNINAGKDQLLQLILVGQPQLKDLLSRPDMLQLAQRIGSDFHLTALTREEVHAYIETRLLIAGARENVFSDDAMDLVAEHSRGVPRVINTIADTALVYAMSAQEPLVSAETVRNVIRDKLDYGVFGIANSPELKLAEKDPRARSGGFLPPDEAAPVTMKVSQTFAPREAVGVAAPIGGPSLYNYQTSPPAEDTPPRARDATPAPRADAPRPASPRIEGPAPARPAPEPSVTGIVIVETGADVAQSLTSAPAGALRVVVVQTGSPTAAAAKAAGVETVEIEGAGLNGGRARNAGYRRLKKIASNLKYAQFIDAGAELDPDWIAFAARLMDRRPEVAVLEGVTVKYRRSGKAVVSDAAHMSDGEIQAAGSDAMFRADAFEAAGGFRGDIIADETADLCIRLRRRGAHIWRSDEKMASRAFVEERAAAWRAHAAADGYAYAAGAALHGGPPEFYCAKEQSRAVVWGAVLPVAIVAAMLFGGVAMASSSLARGAVFVLAVFATGAIAYFIKTATYAAVDGLFAPASWGRAIKRVARHFFECAGVFRYWFSSRKGGAAKRAPA